MERKGVSAWLAGLVFVLAAVGLQLYFNKDFYFAMNRAKCIFTIAVFAAVLLTIVVNIPERLYARIAGKELFVKQRFTLLDWAVLAFGVGSVFTCLFSAEPVDAFVGNKGMFVGAFTYITGMLVYFVVSRYMRVGRWISYTLFFTWMLIFLWSILNQCDVDFFGMHNNMRPQDRWVYIASMGQFNAACDLLSLMLPFGMGMFVLENDKKIQTAWGLFSIIGLIAVFALGSDGVLIGLVASVPFVVTLVMSSNQRIKYGLWLLLILGISMTMFHYYRASGTMLGGAEGAANGVSKFFIGEIAIALAIVLMRYLKKYVITDNLRCLLGRVLSIVSIVLLFGFIAIAVIKSVNDPTFGTGRGGIWKGSVWSFRLYNPLEVVFGKGSGLFADNVTLAWNMLRGVDQQNVKFATCHNSLLQALLGNGLVGLSCLILGMTSLIRDWFKRLLPIIRNSVSKYELTDSIDYAEKISICSFMAIMGYFGSSLVESTYPNSVMMLFVMLALYRSSFVVPSKQKAE